MIHTKAQDSRVARPHSVLQVGQGGGNGRIATNGDGGHGDGSYRVGLHVSPLDRNSIESLAQKDIFISGASGCIGRFLVAYLLQRTSHRITVLVRDPSRLHLPKSLKSAARSHLHRIFGTFVRIRLTNPSDRNRLSLIVGGVEDVDRYFIVNLRALRDRAPSQPSPSSPPAASLHTHATSFNTKG